MNTISIALLIQCGIKDRTAFTAPPDIKQQKGDGDVEYVIYIFPFIAFASGYI